MDKILLCAEEGAELLGIGRSKIWELLLSGQIESVHIGRRRLIPRDALESFVERQRQAADA